MAQIHIGKKIREVVDKSGIAIVAFAESINLSRDGAYKIFAKEYIDTDQLRHISKVLNHDFFAYYSKDLFSAKENKNPYGFASQNDVDKLSQAVLALTKEFEKLRQEITSKKTPLKKKYRNKKK